MSQKQVKIVLPIADVAKEIEKILGPYLTPPAPGYYTPYSRKPIFRLQMPGKNYGVQAPPMHYTVYENGKPNFFPMYFQMIDGQQIGLNHPKEIVTTVIDTDGEIVFSPQTSYLLLSEEQKAALWKETPSVATVGRQIAKEYIDYLIDLFSMWVPNNRSLGDRIKPYLRIDASQVEIEEVMKNVMILTDDGDLYPTEKLEKVAHRSDPLLSWAQEQVRELMGGQRNMLRRFFEEEDWHVYNSRLLYDWAVIEKGPDYRIQQWEKEHGNEYRKSRKR